MHYKIPQRHKQIQRKPPIASGSASFLFKARYSLLDQSQMLFVSVFLQSPPWKLRDLKLPTVSIVVARFFSPVKALYILPTITNARRDLVEEDIPEPVTAIGTTASEIVFMILIGILRLLVPATTLRFPAHRRVLNMS